MSNREYNLRTSCYRTHTATHSPSLRGSVLVQALIGIGSTFLWKHLYGYGSAPRVQFPVNLLCRKISVHRKYYRTAMYCCHKQCTLRALHVCNTCATSVLLHNGCVRAMHNAQCTLLILSSVTLCTIGALIGAVTSTVYTVSALTDEFTYMVY